MRGIGTVGLFAAAVATVVATVAGHEAGATQDAWPALFDVAGVAADDVLNIRAAPDPGAEIIGTLAPDALDVEVVAPDPRERWGMVNTGETAGWVALSYLVRQPGQWAGAQPAIRRCFGTEPFWVLGIDAGGVARWQLPDGPPAEGRVTAEWASENRRDRHGFAVQLPPAHDGLAQQAIGVVAAQACGDGMSDRRYGLSVELLIGTLGGARMLSGCCSLAD